VRVDVFAGMCVRVDVFAGSQNSIQHKTVSVHTSI
jgi:hypothetical protein